MGARSTPSTPKAASGPLKAGSFDQFVNSAHNVAEFLDAETERRLGLAWRDNKDKAARARLIQSHMRQASSQARKFYHPGHNDDLLSSAVEGLIKAVDRFDPDKGSRLTYFAAPWINAELNDYVLNQLGTVKTATTKSQRRAFFGVNRQRQAIGADPTKPLTTAQIKEVANALSGGKTIVSEKDVRQLDTHRMHGVYVSMSMPVVSHSSDSLEFGDTLASPAPSIERQIDGYRDLERFVKAFGKLDPRSQCIFEARRMADEGQEKTLQELATQFNLSAERIRQIEEAADRKLRAAIGLEPKNKRAAAGRSKKSSAARAASAS